jgi:endonuclease/exonuclease/phosphatase family metal-dependent hydrolase
MLREVLINPLLLFLLFPFLNVTPSPFTSIHRIFNTPHQPSSLSLGHDSSAMLTIMSFNIRHGSAQDGKNSWRYRRHLTLATIRDALPDIIGVQEALDFQIDYLARGLDNYQWIGVGRDDGRRAGEHAPLFYRSDRLRVDSSGTFWFSTTPQQPGSTSYGNDQPRICTWARFCDIRNRSVCVVYNLHLDHRSARSRNQSIAQLRNHIQTHHPTLPIIITGDFNALEISRCIRQLTRPTPQNPLQRFADTFRLCHPLALRAGTMHWFSRTAHGPKIDYILTSPTIAVQSAAIIRQTPLAQPPSDHFPLIATIALPPTLFTNR